MKRHVTFWRDNSSAKKKKDEAAANQFFVPTTMMKVAFLLLLPLAASAFHVNHKPSSSSSQTVVQKAITSKWTMMPEEPEPEVNASTRHPDPSFLPYDPANIVLMLFCCIGRSPP